MDFSSEHVYFKFFTSGQEITTETDKQPAIGQTHFTFTQVCFTFWKDMYSSSILHLVKLNKLQAQKIIIQIENYV